MTLPPGDVRAARAKATRDTAHDLALAIGSRHVDRVADALAVVVREAYETAKAYGIDLDAGGHR